MRLTCLVLFTACLLAGGEDTDWINRIRPEHPRLFINKELLPLLQKNAAGPLKEHYRLLQDTCAGYLKNNDIQFHVYECTLPELMLVHLVGGDPQYKAKARWILTQGSRHLRTSFAKKKAVSWFSFARIALYLGYDWLYQDLSPEERTAIAQDLIANVRELNVPGKANMVQGENYFGFPDGGFYGVRNLKWFAGLAFHKEGIADDEMRQWMIDGIEDYRQLAKHRGASGGDDGGMSAVSLGYVFGAYPRAEWNLLHTWRSAIGDNLAPGHAYLAKLVNWISWRTINGGDRGMFCHESGDEHHVANRQELSNIHLAQIQYFFAESHPEQARVAAYLRQINTKKDFSGFHFETIYPFLLDWSRFDPAVIKPLGPDATWAHARHFEFLGEFHMRSGFGPDDTYCLFKAGNLGAGHMHKDENGFSIYHRGFLAMDTGSRDQVGKGSPAEITEYYSQTIAHNCVTIEMPGEKFPHHWGFVPKLNGGGQNAETGTVIRAFATNDHYTYINSDATKVYSSAKAELVNRQFVFIYPSHFVVVDRVTSSKAEYGKTWRLHFQNEPQRDGATVRADQGTGRIFSRTLFPSDAKLELVGGPGKENLVAGVPHPIAPTWFEAQKKKGVTDPLVGHWRLEVKPARAATEDVFIHVLEVGEAAKLAQMHPATLTEAGEDYRITLELGDGRTADLLIAGKDPQRGRLAIRAGAKVLVDEPLATSVQAQTTLLGNQ